MATLPDELILRILHYSDTRTIWTSVSKASRGLRSCAEDCLRTEILPRVALDHPFTLGSGQHHRWYDVRSTLSFAFSHVDSENTIQAVFTLEHVTPDWHRDRALAKWQQVADTEDCGGGSWLATLDGRVHTLVMREFETRPCTDGTVISLNWPSIFAQIFPNEARSAVLSLDYDPR
jgi:hypothetical protein